MGALCCGCTNEVLVERNSSALVDGVEDKIFQLLMDSFCAEGQEAALFGNVLKSEQLARTSARLKKVEETLSELERTDPSDLFLAEAALVDPVAGEVVITYEKIMGLLSKLSVEEIHEIYNGLRAIKVERLRSTHGSDIVSIIDQDGTEAFSECGRRGGSLMRRREAAAQDAAAVDGGGAADVRSLGLT